MKVYFPKTMTSLDCVRWLKDHGFRGKDMPNPYWHIQQGRYVAILP